MIQDLPLLNIRPAIAADSSMGSLRLTSEQGRLLGLRNEQTVRGVLDASGSSILLTTDSASYRLSVTSAFNPLANLLFKAWMTPQGVLLQPLRESLIRQNGNQQSVNRQAVNQAPGAATNPAIPAAAMPSASIGQRLMFLFQLQTPLGALAALNNPQLLQHMLARASTQAQPASAIDQLWSGRDSLSATSIKSAISGSGLLGGGGSAATGVTLRKILEQIRKNGIDMKKHSDALTLTEVDDAIDYLESAKLQGLIRQESGELLFRFPLLLLDAPPVEVRINREQQPDRDDPDASWRIDLDIPLDADRHLDVSLQLLSDASVNVVVWTTNQPLLALMKLETVALAKRFSDWDITLGNVQMVHGERPVPRTTPASVHAARSTQLDCYT